MATKLSQTTKYLKKLFIFFIAFVVIVFIIDYIINSVGPEKDPTGPIGPGQDPSSTGTYPEANNSLGIIPRPVIKSLELGPETKAKFSKDKMQFNAAPSTIYVYELLPSGEQLQDAIKARSVAKSIGFNSFENYQMNNIMYWETTNKEKTLEYDKINKEWTYMNNGPHPANYVNQSSDEEYQKIANKFLESLGILNYRFNNTEPKIYYVKYSADNNFVSCAKNEDCSFVKISFYKQITKIQTIEYGSGPETAPVYKYDPTQGIIDVILAQPDSENEDLRNKLKYIKYKEYEYNPQYGIYKTIDQEKAYTKLQDNEGILIYCRLKDQGEITTYTPLNISEFKVSVDSIKIIYIEPDNWTEEKWTQYLQPFYLLEGIANTNENQEAEFKFLIPALETYE